MKEEVIHDSDILFEKVKKGDVKAYETFFKAYYHVLVAYSVSIVGKTHAEEIAQEIMLSLWENRENITVESSILYYLFGAVRKKCMTHLRRNRIVEDVHEYLYGNKELFLNGMDLILANELSEKLSEAINDLPVEYQRAFKMNRFNNLTYKEIAENLGVTLKSVDYKIQQAIKILRRRLKDFR